jgi:hypothetical protein
MEIGINHRDTEAQRREEERKKRREEVVSWGTTPGGSCEVGKSWL